MRVCILIPNFIPIEGGAEIGAFELCKRLVKRGYEVFVITRKLKKEWKNIEEIEGIKIFRFNTKGGYLGLLFPFIHVGRFLNKINPDILNMHFIIPTGFAGCFWSKFFDIPTVTTSIGWDIYDPIIRVPKILKYLMRIVPKKSDGLTSISIFVKETLIEDFDVKNKKIEIIHYGVDTKRFNPENDGISIRKRYGIKNDIVVLTVQRLEKRKGVEYFIKAIPMVLERFNNIKFMIVGDGPEKNKLKKLCKSLGVSENVIFTGKIPNSEIQNYYKASDIFAFHTNYEGLGIVLLEAMASGKPIITTMAGGTADIIENNINGFIITPRYPELFADTLIKLLKNKKLRDEFGEASREIAEKKFDWEIIVEKYIKVYEEVLNKKS